MMTEICSCFSFNEMNVLAVPNVDCRASFNTYFVVVIKKEIIICTDSVDMAFAIFCGLLHRQNDDYGVLCQQSFRFQRTHEHVIKHTISSDHDGR